MSLTEWSSLCELIIYDNPLTSSSRSEQPDVTPQLLRHKPGIQVHRFLYPQLSGCCILQYSDNNRWRRFVVNYGESGSVRSDHQTVSGASIKLVLPSIIIDTSLSSLMM